MSEICKICEGVSCVNPPDLAAYSLQNLALYNAQYIFLVQCPTGYFCPAGLFPKYVTIKKNRKSIPFPPPGATNISVQGCQSLIVIPIPAGSDTAAINALQQAALLQWAAQQAICDSITENQLKSKVTYFFNDLVSVGCDGDKLINLIGDDYIIPSAVYAAGGRLWMKPGFMVADSVAFANTAAINFLTVLMASLVASGNLQCGYFNTEQSFTCQDDTVQTVAAGQVFSLVSQADADAEALAQAASQCCDITPATLPDAEENVAYSEQFELNGAATTGWTISAGVLPAGITLSDGGLLAGTPTESGTFNFTVTVNACDKAMTLGVTSSATCPNWDDLLWGTAMLSTGKTFSPQNTTSSSFTASATFGGVDVWRNQATVDYNGTGCNCNLEVTFSNSWGSHTVGFFMVDIIGGGDLLTIVTLGNSDQPAGVFNIPFTIPDTLGLTKTIRVTFYGEFLANHSTIPLTFSGLFSNV